MSFLRLRSGQVLGQPAFSPLKACAQALTPTTRPGPNGENLYSALYNLRASQPDDFIRIEEMLKIGFPGFRKLEFPVVGAGQVTMTWCAG
jgi:predicted ATPase